MTTTTPTTTPNENTYRQPEETKYVLHRRFDRMGRLVGDSAMEKLFRSHVAVIGLGGVGSWAAEGIARSGVGKMTVVDFDEICITNGNRQLHALQGLVGKKKAHMVGERLRKINPQAQIIDKAIFYSAETSAEILSDKPDFVVDAIDNITAKCHLLATCRELGIPVITSAGASARMDPLQIRVTDLALTHSDPMAHQVRKVLRQNHNFPRDGEFGIRCVYSEEEVLQPVDLTYDNGEGFKCVCPQGQNDLHSCEKRRVIYGNAGFVTGSFGLVIASQVVKTLVGSHS